MAAEQPKIKLISNDGKTFLVDQDVAFQCQTVRTVFTAQGLTEGAEFPVPEADGKTLEKIIEYLVDFKDVDTSQYEDDRGLTEQEKKYLRGSTKESLEQLMNAADFLNIPDLLDIVIVVRMAIKLKEK